ncbi:MAG: PIN domain-containing protein [Pseudomonadota bacterium]|nr:PIN domain-containing protein [Pseudomonadota bacterium]
MIAVDTNILVYAHRSDSPWHALAGARVRELAEGVDDWAIPWPCIHEFLAIVTHPRIYAPPTRLDAALDQVAAWMESPTLVLLSESAAHWPARSGRIAGPRVHDARIAALCQQHGIRELWSAERDFSGLSGVTTRNPLTG